MEEGGGGRGGWCGEREEKWCRRVVVVAAVGLAVVLGWLQRTCWLA